MLRSLSSRLILGFLLAAFALPLAAIAQSQDDQSVAEAARRAREQRKNLPKPVKVVTEDDIPARAPSADANPPADKPASAQPSGTPADKPAAPAVKDKKTKAAEDAELAALKEAVDKAQREADLAKRDLALDQDTFYSNPDYEHDADGKAKLDELRQLFADKQQTLEQVKAKLAALLPGTPAVPDDSEPPATPPPAPQP